MKAKQWSNSDFCSLLRKNGYSFVWQSGNHQIWSNKVNTISVPSVRINCMLTRRLIKENNIQEATI